MKLKSVVAIVMRNFKKLNLNHEQLPADFYVSWIKRKFFKIRKS